MSEKNCCPKCGRKLKPSDVDGYKFVCFNCDENFYSFEAIKEPRETWLDLLGAKKNAYRRHGCHGVPTAHVYD